MAAKIRVPLPTWAFNYNSPYSAVYSDVPNSSMYYPSYTYMSMNTYIDRQQMPAYVDHALMGAVGQGFSFYGYLNSYIVGSDINTWKETTQVWSMAIPDNFAAPVGLFSLYAWAGCGTPPNYDVLGPSYNYNVCFYVDTDRYLKIGSMANGTSYPPIPLRNTGVDMSQFLYPAAAGPEGNYIGHRYAVVYNDDGESYDLYIDNTTHRLAAMDLNTIGYGAILYMNYETYNEYFEAGGGLMNNYYYIGPGVYMYNYSSEFNVYTQGNVYVSDWYGWHTSMDLRTLNSVLNWNFKILVPPKNSSSYGAMQYCNSMRSITVPGSADIIPYGAISGLNLESVNCSEGITQISQNGIISQVPLTVNVAKSTTRISSGAIQAPTVNAPTVSYNLLMHHNMFSNFASDYPFERYETFEGLSVTNLPLKQPKPLGWYTDARAQLPDRVVMRYNLPDISVVDNLMHCNWYSTNIQLLFNEPINRAVHSNAIGAHISHLNNEGFTLNVHALEQPSAYVSQHCSFVDDEGFYYAMMSEAASVKIYGHKSGMFTDVPAVLDGTLITRYIDFNNSAAVYPSLIEIQVPHNVTAASNTICPTLYINNIPRSVENAIVSNGHYVVVNCNNRARNSATFPCPNFDFINVNYINIPNSYSNAGVTFAFTNCFGIFGTAAPGSTPRVIADNYVVIQGNYDGYDLSDAPLNYRFWRANRGYNSAGNWPLEDDYYLDIIRDTDLVCWNSTLNTYHPTEYNSNVVNVYRDFMAGYNQFNTGIVMNISNSILPDKINISHWMHGTGTFKDCVGDTNIAISGFAFGNYNRGATAPLLSNHAGCVNITINTTPIPFTTYMPYEYGAADPKPGYAGRPIINLGSPGNIGLLQIASSLPALNTHRYDAICEYGTMTVAAADSYIEHLDIQDAHTIITLNNCTLNQYTAVGAHSLSLYNCIVPDIQPLIDCTKSVDLENLAMAASDVSFNVTCDEYGAGVSGLILSNISVANSITITDTTGRLAPSIYANRLNTSHLSYKGLATSETRYGQIAAQFHDSTFETADMRVMILGLGAFAECTNLRQVTGLENCLYIGDNAFRNCSSVSTITVHPRCAIHPNAFMSYNTSSSSWVNRMGDVTILRASNAPIALNVDYTVAIDGIEVDSREVDAPADFGSIHNRIKVNAVYADNTEVPVEDYYIIPDFACSNNMSNTQHTLFAAGCITQICAPYKNCAYPNTTAYSLNLGRSTSRYGQWHEVLNGRYSAAVINSEPYNAGAYYNGSIYEIFSYTTLSAIIFSGNYQRFDVCLKNSYDISYVVATNNYLRWSDSNTATFINSSHAISEYVRDDGMNSSRGNSYFSYGNNSCVHMLDFHKASSYYAMGSNMIRYSNAYAIILPNSPALPANAIVNCRQLFHIGFADMDRSFTVYRNAIINCPALQYLALPRNTTYIESGALNRTGLKTIVIPSNCTVEVNAVPADCTITYY